MTTTLAYVLNYEVPAETAYAAIVKAGELLRHGVRIERVVRVEPTVPGWWEVVFDVNEGGSAVEGAA